jgi:hypothetical protein
MTIHAQVLMELSPVFRRKSVIALGFRPLTLLSVAHPHYLEANHAFTPNLGLV